MARKTPAQPPARTQPTVPPAIGIDLLTRQIESGRALLAARPLVEDDYDKWVMITTQYIEKAFGANSAAISSFDDLGGIGSFPMNAGDAWWEAKRVEKASARLTCLSGLVELLETEQQLAQPAASIQMTASTTGHRIFLVHGHDEGTLHEIARFLERLGQDVVVLREQPNQGRTIIEKFEDYGDVGFAVVLLTPDDTGGPAGGEIKPRARQNVVLELGYFLGRLGRMRVCALYRGDVEIPSDYSGVVYISIDQTGGWRLSLARELKAAGLPVDMNNAV
jgi:predicted nucleotide-binding protein